MDRGTILGDWLPGLCSLPLFSFFSLFHLFYNIFPPPPMPTLKMIKLSVLSFNSQIDILSVPLLSDHAFFVVVFREGVSLWSLGCPGTL